MNKFKEGFNKTIKFLRKNIYYVLIIVCIAAIGTMVTVALTKDNRNAPTIVTPNGGGVVAPDDKDVVNPDDQKPVDDPNKDKPTPVVFISPIENATIIKEYSADELVFSSTIKQWATHLGVDFKATDNTNVVAVYDGVIASIEEDILEGNVVVINHGNGLSTKYCSLGNNIPVQVGQSIKAGTKIGEVSTSMIIEASDGSHLHFETWLNNENINPMSYFIENNK